MIHSQVVADYDDYYDDLTDEDIDDILLTVVAGGLYCDICWHSKWNKAENAIQPEDDK